MEEVNRLKDIIGKKETEITRLLREHEQLNGKVFSLNQMLLKSNHSTNEIIVDTTEVNYLKKEV